MCFSTLPKAFGLGRLASAPLSKVSPLTIIKEKKYPAYFPGLGSGAAAAASEVCPGTRPASPASAEALIFFCFFSSIKGRKEDKKERIKEDNEERESKKKYPLTHYDKENNCSH